MVHLNDSSLFRQQAYVAGFWVDGESGERQEIFNPSTRETIGFVPALGSGEIRRAIEQAEAAWPLWREKTSHERAVILRRWHDLILDNKLDLARIMTLEQGKPLDESMGEVAYAASFIEWFAEEGKRVYGDVIPSPAHGKRMVVIREPVGVCAAITPWNFPAAMITRKVGPALAAGCVMLVKPALETPFSALALAELADRAGIPAGVIQVVTGEAEIIGRVFTDSPAVRKLSFTGSTETGKLLMRQCAANVKRISLELGGHAPFIVFDDADPKAAVAGAIASKYRNSGQTCVCANRFLVQDGIHDQFVERLAEAASRLRVADGFTNGAEQGPLINPAAVEKVESHVRDAVEKGARVVCGGGRHPLGGNFFEPTVIAGVQQEMIVAREETFGPVSPVFRFAGEPDAIRMANDTEYGLAAYFYTRDAGRVWRMADALEYGIIGINTGMVSTAAAPFGGMKQSGIGREGGRYGIDEYLEIKYLCMGGIND